METQLGYEALTALIADLKGFEGRKAIIRELRAGLRAPIPAAREKIRAAAVGMLPAGGGLGSWVAAARVGYRARLSSARSAGLTLYAGRNSSRKRSDIKAIDAGEVRHPSWGHRGPSAWHAQTVAEGFFTRTVEGMADQWRAATISAVDRATEELRRGR